MSFPTYPGYQTSGRPYLGLLPSHWDCLQLKQAARIVNGATPKSENADYWDGNIPWITPADLSKVDSTYIERSERSITAAGLASCGTTFVPSGSVILSTRAPIGSIAIARTNLCTNQGCKSLVPKSKTCAEFLAYLLSVSVVELNARGKGTTFLELSSDELGRFKIPVPPLVEQIAVVRFLDCETAKIDALVDEQRRLIELLKEKRQAVISHAVTKGLNPNAPMKDSGVEWLGQVPAHWEVLRLARAFREVSEQGDASADILSVSIHDGVSDREIAEDERERKVSRSEDRTKYKGVRPGDLVYNMMRAWQGAFGAVRVAGSVSPAYVVARPERDVVTRFIELLLRTSAAIEQMRRYSHGVTDFRLRLYWDDFKTLQIALPPLQEQKNIIAMVDHLADQSTRLSNEAEEAITLLQERRSALISAAVTGKIDVRGLASASAEAA